MVTATSCSADRKLPSESSATASTRWVPERRMRVATSARQQRGARGQAGNKEGEWWLHPRYGFDGAARHCRGRFLAVAGNRRGRHRNGANLCRAALAVTLFGEAGRGAIGELFQVSREVRMAKPDVSGVAGDAGAMLA